MIADLGHENELSVNTLDYQEFPQPKIDMELDLYQKILDRIKKDSEQKEKVFRVYKPFVLENAFTEGSISFQE